MKSTIVLLLNFVRLPKLKLPEIHKKEYSCTIVQYLQFKLVNPELKCDMDLKTYPDHVRFGHD